jgi:hypothetical protein
MRAQYAVSIVVLTLLGLFLFYVLLSTPYERYCMLTGACDNDTNGGNGENGGTPPPGSIYATPIGWIGGTNGDKIGTTHTLNNIATSYLLKDVQVEFLSELSLSPNVIFFIPFAQWRQFDVTVSDPNKTESIEISLTLESEVGNPLVEVLFNNAVVESKDMAADESLTVSITNFEETNTVTLRCLFQGFAFFGSQTCNFQDITLVKKEYDDLVVDTQTLLLSSQEQTAPVMQMKFWVEETEGGGELEIRLNDALLYRGLAELGNNTIESNDVALSDSNTVEFRAARGVSYTITKADVELFSEVEPKDFKVINLPDSVAQQIRSSTDGARFILTVTNVQVDGIAYFTLFPAHITHPADVMEGSVFTDVEPDEIDSIANTIRIESPDAKFYASEFKIVPR